jgi:hypothetical protein
VYLIDDFMIKFVSDLRQVGGFLQVLWFPPPIKLTVTIYNWNIVVSGIKQHNLQLFRCIFKRILSFKHDSNSEKNVKFLFLFFKLTYIHVLPSFGCRSQLSFCLSLIAFHILIISETAYKCTCNHLWRNNVWKILYKRPFLAHLAKGKVSFCHH